MKLIIVESPTKARTISQFLGSDFKVESSYGHVRDLPEKKLGIDLEKDFEPQYVILPKAKKRVAELKSEAKKSEKVILATDEDREGEAISWHLINALELKKKIPYERIVFHEITKTAIENALKNPRDIDENLVDAQQARRILDRLVGYKLSPFLWKKVARGLSAGRVQSVAVRLVAEREKEILSFKPEEFWTISAKFLKDSREFLAQLIKIGEKKLDKFAVKTVAEAEKIINDLKG
ncbi:MAG: topoisomerase protein, partial [Candidatus Yanofskybacteria bacterium GW2011_GWC2_41_9]